ncbi:hypothetical protein [Planktotalea sp.]|uniref:hypothetical protein n=1 Tax=Planktotalea sp. TaxID=2029877 RepID=UPI003F6D011F
MAFKSCTTIAAIVLKDTTELTLDKLADEILQSKIAKHAGSRSLTWDCDDLVFLDFDGLRIGLSEIHETADTPNTICIAVGPVNSDRLPRHLDSGHVAHELVKKITRVLNARAVLWQEYERPLNNAVIDDFHFELDKMLGYLNLQMHGTQTPKHQEQSIPTKNRAELLKDDLALEKLRNTLRKRGLVGDPVSLPLHVSLYIFAVTFFFMIPALGSTLLSYIWLRGGVDKPTQST